MTFLYPGGMWRKRVAYIAIAFTIGGNLFLNDLQNDLFEIGQTMLIYADSLSKPAVEAAFLIEDNVLPFLDYVESTTVGRNIIYGFNLPNTQIIQNGLNNVHGFRQTLNVYGPYFETTAGIIRFTSYLFWIPIALSIIWLILDIYYTKGHTTRSFVVASLILAMPFNLILYMKLHEWFVPSGQDGLLHDPAFTDFLFSIF